MKRGRYSTGFTIVELLVVIAVIAILTMIVSAIFTNAQKQARDTQIRSGAHQLAEAIEIWSANNDGAYIPGGAGSTSSVGPNGCENGTAGWIESGAYLCTVEDTLITAGLIKPDLIDSVPRSTTFEGPKLTLKYAYMLYKCGAATGKALFYYTLEDPTAKDLSDADATYRRCFPGIAFTSSQQYTNFGMRGVILIEY